MILMASITIFVGQTMFNFTFFMAQNHHRNPRALPQKGHFERLPFKGPVQEQVSGGEVRVRPVAPKGLAFFGFSMITLW